MNCPVCGKILLAPYGRPDAKVLILGYAPHFKELAWNRTGSEDGSSMLREELARARISYDMCRVTYFWQHFPVETKKKELNPCQDWMMGEVDRLVFSHPAILLLGAELSDYFVSRSQDEILGLNLMDTKIKHRLPPTVQVAMVAPKPGYVMRTGGTIGEMRLCLQRFSKFISEKELT